MDFKGYEQNFLKDEEKVIFRLIKVFFDVKTWHWICECKYWKDLDREPHTILKRNQDD